MLWIKWKDLATFWVKLKYLGYFLGKIIWASFWVKLKYLGWKLKTCYKFGASLVNLKLFCQLLGVKIMDLWLFGLLLGRNVTIWTILWVRLTIFRSSGHTDFCPQTYLWRNPTQCCWSPRPAWTRSSTSAACISRTESSSSFPETTSWSRRWRSCTRQRSSGSRDRDILVPQCTKTFLLKLLILRWQNLWPIVILRLWHCIGTCTLPIFRYLLWDYLCRYFAII